jgi:hypothetical protein
MINERAQGFASLQGDLGQPLIGGREERDADGKYQRHGSYRGMTLDEMEQVVF